LRGAIPWQVDQIMRTLDRRGQSRHVAKGAARLEGALKSHDIGKKTGIHSTRTLNSYKTTVLNFCRFQKEKYGIKDLTKTSPDAVKAFFSERMLHSKHSTIKTELSAIEKFATALRSLSPSVAWDIEKAIEDVRIDLRKMDRSQDVSRALENPLAIISELQDLNYRLIALIQYEAGFRISEATWIKEHQLMGIKQDPYTGKIKGCIEVCGKGGKLYSSSVSQKTYTELQNLIVSSAKHELKVDEYDYSMSVKFAAEISEVNYYGTHDFRHTHAQERFAELQQHGYSREDALHIVSHEMGHQRPDITERYLK